MYLIILSTEAESQPNSTKCCSIRLRLVYCSAQRSATILSCSRSPFSHLILSPHLLLLCRVFFVFAIVKLKNIPQPSSQGICQTMLYAAKHFFAVKAHRNYTVKYPLQLRRGVSLYHTFSDTPSASYKRCFCFVVALGTALSMASFFLRLAELVIVLPFSSLSPVMPRVAK